MEVFLFTDNRTIPGSFRIGNSLKSPFRLLVCGWKEFRKRIAAIDAPALCYLDLSSLPEGKLLSCLRLIRGSPHIGYGLIDLARRIEDVAQAFHEGAADYLDRAALKATVTVKRLERVLRFVRPDEEQTARGLPDRFSSGPRYLPSGRDWAKVVPEREYTFGLLFIELDGKEEMEKKYGMKNLSIALSSFRNYVENSVSSFGGKLWIWSSFGGIILFPFDGTECLAAICSFRLMLFKHLYDIEESLFPHFLSFRLALDLGNVIYTERNIGSIIADSLNSIFHLGQNFAKPGNFYITAEALRYGHPALRGFFMDAGQCEGRRIMRMRLPVHRKG